MNYRTCTIVHHIILNTITCTCTIVCAITCTNYHTSMYIVSEFYDIKIDVINGVPSSECALSLVRYMYLNRSTHIILTCTDLAPGNGQAEAPLTITNPAPAEISKIYAITVIK